MDLINLYEISPQKIEVCYQSCDARFFTNASDRIKQKIRAKYKLDNPYFLSVGSIIERKNLAGVCEAFFKLTQEYSTCNLVIVGKGKGKYKDEILRFIRQKKLSNKIIFLEDTYPSNEIYNDLPAIYQSSLGLVYPSKMEGFGIPVLEAMASGTPVITSNCSSLIEVAGDAAQTIDPEDINAIYIAMRNILTDEDFRLACIRKGLERAQHFNSTNTTKKVMEIYKQVVN